MQLLYFSLLTATQLRGVAASHDPDAFWLHFPSICQALCIFSHSISPTSFCIQGSFMEPSGQCKGGPILQHTSATCKASRTLGRPEEVLRGPGAIRHYLLSLAWTSPEQKCENLCPLLILEMHVVLGPDAVPQVLGDSHVRRTDKKLKRRGVRET